MTFLTSSLRLALVLPSSGTRLVSPQRPYGELQHVSTVIMSSVQSSCAFGVTKMKSRE